MSAVLGLMAVVLAGSSTANVARTCEGLIPATTEWLPSEQSPIQIVGALLISIEHCVDEAAGRIRSECECGLLEIGAMLQVVVVRSDVLIEGHTSRSLSLERDFQRADRAATAVVRFLVTPVEEGGAGLAPERIAIISYGSIEPIVQDKKDRRNDRVQIALRPVIRQDMPVAHPPQDARREMPVARPREDVDYK